MAIINSYPTITPALNDLVLISDTSVEGNPTKTASINSISTLVNKGFTSYVAKITQSSTAAPVPTVISNDTGLTITWSRSGTGDYRISAFDRAGESMHTHEYNPETNRLEKIK